MKKFPRLASAYMRLFCEDSVQQELEGDILSNYNWRFQKGRKLSALFHFTRDVLLTARFLFSREFGPSVLQIAQSSFKIYFRNARKNKRIFLFNMLGLFIGILCFLAIYSFYQFENAYDSGYTDANRIFRIEKVEHDREKRTNGSSYLLYQYGQQQIAGIEQITGLINGRFDRMNFQYPEGNPWHALHHMAVKPNFFEVFDFDFVEGQAENAFKKRESIVITEALRQKIFDQQEAVGQIVLLNERPFEVAGVIVLPENTHFAFDYLLLDANFFANPFWDQERLSTDWHYADFIFHYAKITQGSEGKVIDQLNKLYAAQKLDDEPEASFLLHPVTDIHLGESTDWELADNGNGRFVKMMMVLGIIILVLVAVNHSFINIAQTSNRLKELGIRNILGSSNGALFLLIIIENSLSVLMAAVLAFICLFQLDSNLPFDLPLDIHAEMVLNPESALLILSLAFGLALISSLSPILLVRQFKPIPAIQGRISSRFGNSAMLRVLMSVQVVFSLGLIITMVFFHEQLNFILGKDPGFAVENIGYMERYDRGENRPSYDVFKEKLLQIPGVKKVSHLVSVIDL